MKGHAVDPISPAAQKKDINAWAAANDAEVVKITEDLSTTGGMSAFRRPGLGPWLTDPAKIATWDVLVVTKLDRACRNLADYLKLTDWCERNGKRLVILDDPTLDTTTPSGRAMANVRATFAQYEREMAITRNKERYAEMVAQGKWPGGRLPYGWRNDDSTGRLVPDDGGTADVLRVMADRAIAGKSNGQLAEWLNDSGNFTMIGRRWRPDTVRRVLHAPMTELLLGDAKAAELRAALRSRGQAHGERVGGHMLLRVAFCRTCQSPLYGHFRHDRARLSYRCIPCGWYIPGAKLEGFAEQSLLKAAGTRKLRERVLVPGDDHQAAIHALEREVETLRGISGTDMVVEAKEAEIEHLKALPFEPDRYVLRPTDITVAEHWKTLDAEGKGSFLRTWGVRIEADKTGAKLTTGWLDADDDEWFPATGGEGTP